MRTIRSRRNDANYWPGFVDALATLLLVIIFLLSIFMLSQFFLSQALTGRNAELAQLNARLAELANLLDLERAEKASLEETIGQLQASLAEQTARAETAEAEVGRLGLALGEAEDLNEETTAQVALLNQQLAALRQQLASLQEALEAAEAKDKESQAVIADLGKRLNAALAQKVSELAKYRSEFFGKLREALGDRTDIQIVGDRFVFQSEVLFASGSADINESGKEQLRKVAVALNEIGAAIPEKVNWVLRVDGHTDRNPIRTAQFPSNWELSTARALSVVRFLISQGVPAKRLIAAGFGEYHPLDATLSAESLRRNRRIELKLTER